MSAITLTGRVEADAEARSTRDGVWSVSVRVALPAPAGAKPMTVMAVQQMGTGNAAALAARNRAHHLKRGVRATVHAECISWKRGRARVDTGTTVHTPDLYIGRDAGQN
jgi:hypothetical protein